MNEVLGYIPEITAAGGYVVGQLSEQVARTTILRNRQSLMPAHERVNQPAGTKQSVLHRATAQLALIGTMTGFAIGEAIKPTENHLTAEPVVAIAIDHSFATGQDGSLPRINSLANSIFKAEGLHVQGLLAHNGSYSPVINTSEIDNDVPFGGPSLDSTVKVSINNAFNTSRSSSSSTGENRQAATLVLTDNESIGDATAIITHARQQGNQPVFVVNEAKATQPNDYTVKQLENVTNQTGGRYWPATADSTAVADTIKQSVVSHQVIERQTDDKASWIAMALLAAGTGVLQFFRRKNETAFS